MLLPPRVDSRRVVPPTLPWKLVVPLVLTVNVVVFALVMVGTVPSVTGVVAEAAPVPVPLVAVTEHVYEAPLVKPGTVTGEALPVPVIPPGLQVAV